MDNESKKNKRSGKPMGYSAKSGGRIKRDLPPQAAKPKRSAVGAGAAAEKPRTAARDLPRKKAKKSPQAEPSFREMPRDEYDHAAAGTPNGKTPTERHTKAARLPAEPAAEDSGKPKKPKFAPKKAAEKGRRFMRGAGTAGADKNGINDSNENSARASLSLIEGGRSPARLIRKYAVIGVIAVIVIAVAAFCFTRPTGFGEWVKCIGAKHASGEGFPVRFEDSSASALDSDAGVIYALGDSDIRCYSRSGGLVYVRPHGYTAPVMRISAVRTLTFDRGGTGYRIDSAADECGVFTSPYRIIDADIADNGWYAIASFSDSDTALVTVYDKNGNEKYKFHSAESYISSVAISADGKYIAVCSLGADHAVMNSHVMIYSVKSTEPQAKKSFTDETVYAVRFNGSTVTGVSTGRVFTLDRSNNYREMPFNSQTPVKFDLRGGKTVVVLSGASNSAKNTVYVLNGNLEPAAQFGISGTVESVCATGERVYVLSSELTAYSYAGEILSEQAVSAGVSALVAFDKKAAVLYSNSIELY